MHRSRTPGSSCARSRRGSRPRKLETAAPPRLATPPRTIDMTRELRRMTALALPFAIALAPLAAAQTPPTATPPTTVSAGRPLALADAIRIAEEQSEAI